MSYDLVWNEENINFKNIAKTEKFNNKVLFAGNYSMTVAF